MRGGVGKGQGVKTAEKVYENKDQFGGVGRVWEASPVVHW